MKAVSLSREMITPIDGVIETKSVQEPDHQSSEEQQWSLRSCLCGLLFWILFVTSIFIVWNLFLNLQIKSNVILKTYTGLIKGSIVRYNAKLVYTFLGIPYAEPPIGRLRFRRPLPVRPWNRTLATDQHPARCHQYTIENRYLRSIIPSTVGKQSEDCLYLNIYTAGNNK